MPRAEQLALVALLDVSEHAPDTFGGMVRGEPASSGKKLTIRAKVKRGVVSPPMRSGPMVLDSRNERDLAHAHVLEASAGPHVDHLEPIVARRRVQSPDHEVSLTVNRTPDAELSSVCGDTKRTNPSVVGEEVVAVAADVLEPERDAKARDGLSIIEVSFEPLATTVSIDTVVPRSREVPVEGVGRGVTFAPAMKRARRACG
jgi:hypothetical protein